MNNRGLDSIFYEGLKYFNANNYKKARECFEISLKTTQYRTLSIEMLFKIEILEGKFSEVRENVNLSDIEEFRKRDLLAQLDNSEYNYIRSRKAYRDLVREFPDNPIYLLRLSKVCLNMGYFEDARKYLQKLQDYDKFRATSLLELVVLEMVQGNYEEALRKSKLINKKFLSYPLLKQLEKLRVLISYHLGKDLRNLVATDNTKYTLDILQGKRDTLMSHLMEHKGDTQLRFREDIDLDDLLEEAEELIGRVNPSINFASNCYRVNLDHPIGYNGEKELNGLSIVTLLNTPKIITMFPEDFSDEFDVEGFSKSDRLAKRLKSK